MKCMKDTKGRPRLDVVSETATAFLAQRRGVRKELQRHRLLTMKCMKNMKGSPPMGVVGLKEIADVSVVSSFMNMLQSSDLGFLHGLHVLHGRALLGF